MLSGARAQTTERPIGPWHGDAPLGEASPDALKALCRAQRILVLGSSGAGKTHLSHRLGGILGLDPIHLDDHFWLPDGSPRGDREWREIVTDLAARDSWIMDGTYERSLDLRLPRADAILMLECSPARCLERVLQRETETPSPQWLARSNDVPARVDRDHVKYVSRYASATRPIVLESIARHARGKTVVMLEAEAVEPFVSNLPLVSA